MISVPWLGIQLIGELLSTQFLLHARVTGVYTVEDFQASYNQCDALGVLDLLEALDLCVQVCNMALDYIQNKILITYF